MRLGDEDDLPEGVDPENRGPLDSDAERLVDLAALRADDALVEELAAGLVAHRELPAESRGTEAELVAMLAAWVSEVRPEAATGADAVSSAAEHTGAEDVAAGQPPVPVAVIAPPGRHRAVGAYARRLAIAAALVVLGTSGLAAGAANATPGEALWPVSKVFYAERARSVEAAAGVTGHLDQARTALRSGQTDAAAKAIADAAAGLPEVRPAEGHDDLARAQQLLLDALGSAPAEPNRSSSGHGDRPDRERTSPDPSESGSAEPEPGNANVTPSGAGLDQDGEILASPPAGSFHGAPSDQVPGGGPGVLEPGPGTPAEPDAPATGSEPALSDEAGSQEEGDEPRSAEPESRDGDGSEGNGSGGTADDDGESDDNSTRDGATADDDGGRDRSDDDGSAGSDQSGDDQAATRSDNAGNDNDTDNRDSSTDRGRGNADEDDSSGGSDSDNDDRSDNGQDSNDRSSDSSSDNDDGSGARRGDAHSDSRDSRSNESDNDNDSRGSADSSDRDDSDNDNDRDRDRDDKHRGSSDSDGGRSGVLSSVRDAVSDDVGRLTRR